MALRQLILSKKIEQRKAALNELIENDKDLSTREAELETALEEAATDEEMQVVEDSITELEQEKTELAEKKSKLEGEISELEGELEQLNSKEPNNDPKPDTRQKSEKAEGEIRMRSGKFFNGMTREAVNALIARDDVKDFLTRTRELIGNKRAVTGAELNIPEIMLDLLRDNLHRYSKLITKVRLKPVAGKARQNVAGTIPEGIWTEAIGKLNELEMQFNQIEVDGYKVGGFIPVPNSTLEDSDLNLANEIMDASGQAIGLAVDKAIVFGTGTKMPLGFVTRLAQTAEPSNWGTNAPAWVDLHTSNIITIDPTNMTAQDFFAALLLKLGVASPNYSTGGTFWVMNRKTKMTLMSKALTFNAAGAIVAGQMGTIPVEGGEIIELDFMADGDIAGGFGSLYLLAERAGSQIAVSEHVRFIEDQTVFKGTARYDGAPALGEGFVIVNIENTAPTTSVTFAQDDANVPEV
jgi:HK97 family phage major capsid protein